jgi:hypothetical protein
MRVLALLNFLFGASAMVAHPPPAIKMGCGLQIMP